MYLDGIPMVCRLKQQSRSWGITARKWSCLISCLLYTSFDVYDGSLIVNLNKNILASNRSVKQDVYNALGLSLAALPGIEKGEVRVDGVTVSPKDQKEDMVSVYALTYNEVQF